MKTFKYPGPGTGQRQHDVRARAVLFPEHPYKATSGESRSGKGKIDDRECRCDTRVPRSGIVCAVNGGLPIRALVRVGHEVTGMMSLTGASPGQGYGY